MSESLSVKSLPFPLVLLLIPFSGPELGSEPVGPTYLGMVLFPAPTPLPRADTQVTWQRWLTGMLRF